jgi:SAM-dependent methyltransferase
MTTIDPAPLKELQKFMWSQGDFERVSLETTSVAEGLAAAAGVTAGEYVLDVAAGTGNSALAAANRGARVVASDLTPRMVEVGRRRTEGLDIEWLEADAEALPFADATFDRVLTSFGAMFAPRPEVAAGELFRVVRPGGTVAMANWTPDSYPGRSSATLFRYLPAPEDVPRPMEWGVEDVVRERLGPHAAQLRIERRVFEMVHDSVDAMLEFQQRNMGPLAAARMALGERFADVASDLRAVITELNRATDGSVRIESGYLLVVASAPPSS